ncbi:MAG TPA: peptidoglycan DD-metalloendopeptidase family protein [Ramlibacter sp.]|nr:peptidoglycan DD-metalloendopeptidase family protein [Ramlibacter sp.]
MGKQKMFELRKQGWMWAVLAAGLLAGCASSSRAPAPVEDRSTGARAQPAAVEPAKPASAADNAGKPGYYTIRPGDTLIRIALDSGQNWRDIQRWNSIDNPNVIEVGQVIRVIPPAGAADATALRPAATAASAPGAAASAARGTTPPTVVAVAPPTATGPAPAPSPAPAGEEELPWAWPTAPGAAVVAGFDEQRNKGLDIAGKQGDAVLASADGRVVYAGAGLRGYGNLIILKHNNTYLSAYAHNQALLVKEDQTVRKGQKIAEMGSSDADRVKLHFEIRRQGKPVDPARYLPVR